MLKQDIQPVAGEGTYSYFTATQESTPQGYSAPQFNPWLSAPVLGASNLINGQLVQQVPPFYYSMLQGANAVIQGIPASPPQTSPGYSRATAGESVNVPSDLAYGESYIPQRQWLRNPVAYIQSKPVEGVILLVLALFLIVILTKSVMGLKEGQ
jgi:hypothetical protein